MGTPVTTETAEQRAARFEAENAALRQQIANSKQPGRLTCKIGASGGMSVYGLGRFPVTLYKEQWLRLLDIADGIKAFLAANAKDLKTKPVA